MLKFLLILMSAMLISGCRGGGGSGFSSSYLDDYAGSSSSSSSYTSDYPANSSPTYYPVGDSDFASDDSADTTDYAHTPEPCTLVLFGIGLAGMAYSTFKKKKR